jgi:hypothetical protein
MSLSRPGETEPIHSVSYGHVAACQLIGPHTLALRVGESQLLLQSPQVSGKKGCGRREVKKHLLNIYHAYSCRHWSFSSDQRQVQGAYI